MSSDFGKHLRIQLFGQSHSEALGVVIDGLPAGIEPDMDRILHWLKRRAPGGSALSSPRKEPDLPEILSGLAEGKTCGAPLCAIFRNKDTRSEDYDALKHIPRPGHADYTAYMKTGGANDIRGGGHFSARLTAPLVFAGALCAQLLEEKDIFLGAHIRSIGPLEDRPFDPVHIMRKELDTLKIADFPVLDPTAGHKMKDYILETAARKDSVGGIVECCVLGLPPGLGEPIFDGLENRISAAVFGIPAVKGIEFGDGFETARSTGSVNNDAFFYEAGQVRTKTNHNGGILGGLASGMPLIFRAAFKPTPSIGLPQDSVDLSTGQNTTLTVRGRHDPCVVPRAVPCVEAAAAIALYDLCLGDRR
ncbi:MAG TPA: chorismate synthase [Bacillota bacterium]|nr:chorismate synthase [Bacillota bacterium]